MMRKRKIIKTLESLYPLAVIILIAAICLVFFYLYMHV
jgi:hypothetical protein